MASQTLQRALIPTKAINAILQPLDADACCLAMTDASFDAFGGSVFLRTAVPWLVKLPLVNGICSLAGLPLPRRMKPHQEKLNFYDRLKTENRSKTTPNIGMLEFLAVAVQLEIMEIMGFLENPKFSLVTFVGDNTGVILALESKRSMTFDPFLRWIEKKLRPKGFNVRSIYLETNKIPADVLSRPSSEGVDWPEYIRKAKDICDCPGFENLSAWLPCDDKNVVDVFKPTAEKVWTEIWNIGVQHNLWL